MHSPHGDGGIGKRAVKPKDGKINKTKQTNFVTTEQQKFCKLLLLLFWGLVFEVFECWRDLPGYLVCFDCCSWFVILVADCEDFCISCSYDGR